MTLASGTRAGLSFCRETAHGTTPATPTFKTLRATERNINLTKTILESAEVNPHRNYTDVRHGFNSVSGSAGYELSRDAFDDVLSGALGSAWATPGAATTNLSTSSVDDSFNRATGSFITDGFKAGMFLTAAGFTNAPNNGHHRILTVSALKITTDSILVTEAAAGGHTAQLTGETLKIGTNLTTYSVLRRFDDVQRNQLFRGTAINKMDFNVAPDAIVRGSIDFLGMSATDMLDNTELDALLGTSGLTPTPAPSHAPYAGFDGAIFIGGEELAVVTAIDLTLTNNRKNQGVVGSKFSPDIFEGRASVEGKLSFLLEEDSGLYSDFFNEVETSIAIQLLDLNGDDFLVMGLPRVKINSAEINPPQEGPIVVSANYRAIFDPATFTSLWFQKTNATTY
jgi:hypothetical protein